MTIRKQASFQFTFHTGKEVILTKSEEHELRQRYESFLTPAIREQAKKDYAPQMGHIALAAAIGFSRNRYIDAGEMSKINPSDIKKEVPVDDDDEDFLDTVSDGSEEEYPDEYPDDDCDEWDDDDWVTDPEEGDR